MRRERHPTRHLLPQRGIVGKHRGRVLFLLMVLVEDVYIRMCASAVFSSF